MTWAHPRRILWLLAAATLVPIGVLSWLGVRIVQQDRDVERQREALDVSARRLALDIEQQLQGIEEGLARGGGVILSPEGPLPSPTLPLLYQSPFLRPDEFSAPGFAEAEAAVTGGPQCGEPSPKETGIRIEPGWPQAGV